MRKIFILIIAIFLLFSTDVSAKTLSYIPKNPNRALIIIHGYGGDGKKMTWMTETLKNRLPNMAFYYPTAPDRALVGGYQWFKIPITGEQIKEKTLYDKMVADALRNVEVLHNLVDEIHDTLHLSYQNIYVAGFSQGGLMALLTTLTNPHQLPVAVSFSGVPLLLTPDFTLNSVKGKPDILIMQGTNDSIVPADSLKMTTETLLQMQIEPMVRIIKGMTHSINKEALDYAIEFME